MAEFNLRSTLDGLLKTLTATDTPDVTPANDAGKLPVLNAGGQLDPGFIAASGSTFPATNGAVAFTGVQPLCFVAGLTVFANATDVTLPVMGFSSSAALATDPISVITPGHVVSGLSGMTPDARQYLDTTAGGLTEDVSAFVAGNGVQYLGRAISATELMFIPADIIEL